MWIRFEQHNSGGYYITNKDIGNDVFIEGDCLVKASDKFFSFSDKYPDLHNFCECCGLRWKYYTKSNVPMIGDKPLTEGYPYKGYAVLHYLDGTIKYVEGLVPEYKELEERPK